VAKEHIEINYVFRFEDQKDMRFGVALDPTTSTIVRDSEEPTPQWAKLEHHQCPNCPLESASCGYCLVASNMASVVKNCNEIISHKSLELEVVTPERTISTKTTAQRALSSLLGLVIATSDCPHTRFFRPMARFHLPMASQEETVFRVVSTYCLASYYRMQSEPVLGLGTLHDIYTNMQKFLKKKLKTLL